MKTVSRILIFIIGTVLFSCEKPLWILRCHDCVEKEPSTVTIVVRLNPSSLTNHSTEIKVYSGHTEGDILLGEYTTFAEKWYHTVPLNKKYTISASYYNSGRYYTATGSVLPGVRYEENLCDAPCYITYDYKLDLRIKYW